MRLAVLQLTGPSNESSVFGPDSAGDRISYLSRMASFAGSDGRADVNVGAFQPFGMYQLGKGRYLRSTGIWVYDFETDNYTVPLGIGIGQEIPKGNTVYNIFVEPQWSVVDKGAGWPEWQVFLGFNM